MLSVRLDAETEAALDLVMDGRAAPNRREAAKLAIRYEAVRVAGREGLERAMQALVRRRARQAG